MGSDKLKKLMEHRDGILLAEIGALIHDLGKLSGEFVRSKCIEGSGKKWIHHTAIIELDVYRSVEYANDVKRILKNVKIDLGADNSTNLYDFILGHHPKNWGKKEKWDEPESYEFEYPAYDGSSILLKFIIASDIFDSEEDKSHCKDPQSICGVYRSTPFGFEKDVIMPDYLKEERVKIYKILKSWINSCNIDEIINRRRKIFDKIKESFSKALGETRRSANDVTLWDHSYMTASIMKALLAQYILCKSFESENKCKEFLKGIERKDIKPKEIIINTKPFKIFAIGWDFFGFIRQSHKIPDVIGRIKVLEEIKNDIRKIVEKKYALGNSIYNDNLSIYFLIPSIIEENDLKDVKEEIFDIFNEKVCGIISPVFHLEKPNPNGEFRIGEFLTNAIDKIKEKIRKHEVELIKKPKWIDGWEDSVNVKLPKEKLICNVCGKGYYCKGNEEKICDTCREIRNKGREKDSESYPQTIFIDEIAWNPKRKQYENACLLIAKFDLDEWLNGEYVRSLFIKKPIEEQSVKQVYAGQTKNILKSNVFRKYLDKKWNEDIEENIRRNLNYLPEEIRDILISDLISELKRQVGNKEIKYIMGSINKIVDDIFSKYDFSVVNFINKPSIDFQKPPSPSRLMRIWNNTKDFFEDVAKEICLKAPLIEEYKIILENEIKGLIPNMVYILEMDNKAIGEVITLEKSSKELFVITPHTNTILSKDGVKLKGKEIILRHPDSKKIKGKGKISKIETREEKIRKVRAFRIISISPTLFMAIIPASESIEIVKTIRKKYLEHFGKVFGKLPLHIGLIYFKRKMPIFVALDSAMRFVNEFESLKGEDVLYVIENPITVDDYVILELSPTKDGQESFKYTVKIPYKLGDGNPDYYYPYLMIKSSSKDTIEIKCDGSPIVQKHISKIEEEDIIKMKKYYLDFEFLDSNIRRFDVGRGRKHWLFAESTNRPKPYLLWDINNFERLRKLIQKLGLTTTQIMNLYEMLMAKIEEWGIRKLPVELLNDTYEKEKAQVFEKLVENAIKDIPLRLEIIGGETSKGKISREDYEFLKASILTGMFFDFVDLWHTILKKNFEKGGEENV